jgi:ABC-type nitrate/sulfonate/bicarbonate transport system substrate-binding protein
VLKNRLPGVIRNTAAQFVTVVFALVCLFSLPTAGCRRGTSVGTSGKVTFALPTADWWTASPFILSQSDNFFRQRDLDVTTVEVNSGLASKNAVVAGTADIGLAAATPLALAAAKNEGLVILGTYLSSNAVVGLVRPREMLEKAIPPEPVAVVPSTISEFYLYEYLVRIGQQKVKEGKQLKELHVRPADIPGSLRNGSAKSAVIWEPFLSLSAEEPGFVVDRTVQDYQVSLFVITRPAFMQSHPQQVEAFMKALEDSCNYLKNNSEEARHQVERRFGFRVDFLRDTWPKVQYGVSFDRGNMTTEMIREAQIAKALGYIPSIPNVDYMFTQTQH